MKQGIEIGLAAIVAYCMIWSAASGDLKTAGFFAAALLIGARCRGPVGPRGPMGPPGPAGPNFAPDRNFIRLPTKADEDRIERM